MASSSLRIVRGFRRAGLYLDPEALELVAEFAEKYDEDIPSLVEEILAGLSSRSATISRADVEPILEGFLKRGLLTADSDPLSLDTTQDRIIDDDSGDIPTKRHAAPEAKWSRFVWRYELLRWRLKRTGLPESVKNRPGIKLCEIKALRESSHSVAVFGILREIDGGYALEEPGGCVPLNLELSKPSKRIFVETGFVIVIGHLMSDVFHVQEICLPPAERRAETLQHLPLSSFASKFQDQLEMTKTKDASNYKLAIFRDVYLDDSATLRRFDHALTDLEAVGALGTIIIVCGSFLSNPRSASIADYTQLFNTLADLIGQHDQLAQHNRFIFVGTDYACGARSLPRFGPPGFCTQRLRDRVRHAHFPSNPSRIWHGPDEIVIFHHHIIAQMKESSVFRLSDDNDSDDYVQTLLDQGHLSPLPDSLQPVYWARDPALHLFPLPSILILADESLTIPDAKYKDCRILCPDHFTRTMQYGVYDSVDDSFTVMQAR